MADKRVRARTADRRVVVPVDTWELLAAVAGVVGREARDLAKECVALGAARLYERYEPYWRGAGRLPLVPPAQEGGE